MGITWPGGDTDDLRAQSEPVEDFFGAVTLMLVVVQNTGRPNSVTFAERHNRGHHGR